MATGFGIPSIIVPTNAAPLPAGFATGGVRAPSPQQIWPGQNWTNMAGAPPVDAPPPLPTGWDVLPPTPTYKGPPPAPAPAPTTTTPVTPPRPPTTDPDYQPRPDDPNGPPAPAPTTTVPVKPPPEGDPGPEPTNGPWKPDVAPYIQQLLDYLNARKQGWQQQYRGLGNTPTSWYDWMVGQNSQPVTDWIRQNWLPSWASEGQNDPDLGLQLWNEGTASLNSAFQNWLRQNSVNYTNPIRLPAPNRMQVPVTDWTRLAGPEYGIPSGFSERATKSPWAADYRGGAFGPTGRIPSWTNMAGA